MTTTKQIYTLEDMYAQRFAPLSTLDLERVSLSVQAFAADQTAQMNNMLDWFSDETVKSRSIWGGTPVLAFDTVGEFGRGEPRSDVQGQELHYPLRKLSATRAASEEFWKRASVGYLRDQLLAMEAAYAQQMRDEIKAAVFNTGTFPPAKDWLVDNTTLNKIQPFLNADGAAIPNAPNGTSFANAVSTHTHYLGITGSTVAVSDVNYLLGHVREHVVGKIVLVVDGNMPATLNGLSSTPFVYNQFVNVIDQTAAKIGATVNRDGGETDRNNMFIGTWDGHEVHTRSWCPTNYLVALAIGGQLGKPLLRRTDAVEPGLRVAADISDGRLRIKESYFYVGFGAFNRAGAAVMDCATGSNAYSRPSGLIRP